jgi:hypothetical protein
MKGIRVPDAAQRAELTAWCAANPGPMDLVDPGSAAQRHRAAPRPEHESYAVAAFNSRSAAALASAVISAPASMRAISSRR